MPFQPGNTHGKGRPVGHFALPGEIKEAKKLAFLDFQNIIYKLLEMNPAEIQAFIQNPHATMKELLLASILNKALVEGDPIRLTWLMTAIFGKNVLERVKQDLRGETDNPEFLREIPSSIIIDLLRKNKEVK